METEMTDRKEANFVHIVDTPDEINHENIFQSLTDEEIFMMRSGPLYKKTIYQPERNLQIERREFGLRYWTGVFLLIVAAVAVGVFVGNHASWIAEMAVR